MGIFFKAFHEAMKVYKETKRNEKMKKKLVNKDCDFRFLEKLIQECNENPALHVDVFLHDGTKISMRTWIEEKRVSQSGWNYVEVK